MDSTIHRLEMCDAYTTSGYPNFKPDCRLGYRASLKCHSIIGKHCPGYKLSRPISKEQGESGQVVDENPDKLDRIIQYIIELSTHLRELSDAILLCYKSNSIVSQLFDKIEACPTATSENGQAFYMVPRNLLSNLKKKYLSPI